MGSHPLALAGRATSRSGAATPAIAGTGIAFLDHLASHGDRPALVQADGTEVSYVELADRVAERAAALGSTRRLVLVEAANAVPSVVAWLGALAGGHPAVLVNAVGPAVGAVLDRFDPDVVAGADGSLTVRRHGTTHDLHPQLAALLSTSGTTGSAKLVRLSGTNLAANAAAIATSLDLRQDDRAVTTLPLGYCYGLSVLHSHLHVGASVVLQDDSVVDPCFWARFRAAGATSLAGVPHTFELLDRAGFADLDLPTLRRVTQAGGRLAPDVVRRYAALGRRRGWHLVVMYGQTEATARMAVLPPALAEARPEAIGSAIPGGSLALAPVEGGDPDVGELVYRGPNVMLGYATGPADLALGRTVDVLRTGDLARRGADGLFEVCGRRSRFVKPFGLRVDLDRVEALAAEHGAPGLVAGDDHGIALATTAAVDVDDVAARLATRIGLPRRAVAVVAVDELPRTASGKPDLPAVLAAARTVEVGPGAVDHPRHGDTVRHPVDALFCDVLGVASVADDDTFVALGGDSLSYVEASVGLERVLGHAPAGWHLLPVHELRAVAPRSGARRLDTTVALRAAAIVGVVLAHAGLLPVAGSAHVLLGVAGLNAARFTIGAGGVAGWATLRRGLRQAGRIAAPTVAFLAGAALVVDGIHPSTVALTSAYAGEGTWRYRYWFVEVLVVLLAVVAAATALRPVARLERHAPFGVALAAVGLALAVRHHELGAPGWDELKVHAVAWVFALGWAAERARRRWQQAVVTAVVVVAVAGWSGSTGRDALIAAGLLALVWVPSVPVPRRLHGPLGALAGASLAVYLVHWPVLELLAGSVPAPVAAVAALLAGWAGWHLVGALGRNRRTRAAVAPTARTARPALTAERAPALTGAR